MYNQTVDKDEFSSLLKEKLFLLKHLCDKQQKIKNTEKQCSKERPQVKTQKSKALCFSNL